MNRQTIALALTATLLAACAAPAPEDTKTAQAKPECEREYQTGSMIAKKGCTPALSPEERQRMQDALSSQIRPTASNPGGGGSK